jgi:hypothetical protein
LKNKNKIFIILITATLLITVGCHSKSTKIYNDYADNIDNIMPNSSDNIVSDGISESEQNY